MRSGKLIKGSTDLSYAVQTSVQPLDYSTDVSNLLDNVRYVITNTATTFTIQTAIGEGNIQFTAGPSTTFTLPTGQAWAGEEPTFESGLTYNVFYYYEAWYTDGGR